MAECASCGRALTDAHMFCPRCGTPVVKAPAPPAKSMPLGKPANACPSCGAGLPDGALFCGECGKSIPRDAGAASAVAATPPPRSAAPTYTAPPAPRPAPPVYTEPPAPRSALQDPPLQRPPFASPTPWDAIPQAGPVPTDGAQRPYGPAPSPMGDYLTFRRMITPSLIQILFWLMETLNLFYWVRLMINTRYYAWSVLTGLLGLVVCAILIRVYLELLMVLFRIRSDVASIKRKMGEG